MRKWVNLQNIGISKDKIEKILFRVVYKTKNINLWASFRQAVQNMYSEQNK